MDGVAEQGDRRERQGLTGRADVTQSAKVDGASACSMTRRTAGWKPATVSAAAWCKVMGSASRSR